MSHVYGKDKQSENLLRTFKDGKLKVQVSILKIRYKLKQNKDKIGCISFRLQYILKLLQI